MNNKVNYGLGVSMMCQYRFINCNKCTTLVNKADNGGGWECVEWEVCGKFVSHSLNFVVNLNLFLKNKVWPWLVWFGG